MKKSMKLLAILLFVVLMSGCVKYNFKMEVGKDKSVTIEIIDAIDKEYSSYGSYETEATAAEAKGFSKTAYEDEEWIGYTLTKKYNNINDISSEDPVTVELMDILSSDKEEPKAYFQKKNGLFKTTYIANFTVNISDDEADDSSTTEDEDESSSDGEDISYTIILPVKADDNNATIVSEDGKTLTWTLSSEKLNTIKYEFSMMNTTMIIIVGAVAAIIVVGVGVVVTKGKKKPNVGGGMPMNNQPGMPQQPMMDPMMPQDGQSFMPGPQPNPMDANPLGAVVQPQPMENNMFGQPAPEQNFMPADGMPSLENQPPIVDNQPAPIEFGQPAPFPEVNLDAAPEVAPAEVPAFGLENNMDTVVMPPVENPGMEIPAVDNAFVTPEVAAPEVAPMGVAEMPETIVDPNNNIQ